MSRYYGNYSQYLGAQRCCDSRGQGPQGEQGPTGPASIGSIGNTGPTGASVTGPTGRSCMGPTGPTGSKTFVINHPTNSEKFLVHGCLEGPEAGVYYRGKGSITNNEYVEIELPHYVENLASVFTVQITTIYNGKIVTLNCSEVENNKFRVYGENATFHWCVHGKRHDIVVEPNKNSVDVKGDGPYLYI
jgi:hypothetical protein